MSRDPVVVVTDPYAELSRGYAGRRQPDPRIARQVGEALGDARVVLNVGAGAGSYEPGDRTVLAVEPSVSMIAQRPPGSAPVVRAVAGALPVRDGAVDAALAVLTVHHWPDPVAGLHELRRVSARQVVLTWDPSVMAGFWLVTDHLPELADAEDGLATVAHVVDGLSGPDRRVEVRTVPVPADCTDGFLGAYWNRPGSYLDARRRAAVSAFSRLPADVVDRGVARLADDLRSGRWDRRHGHLRDRSATDLGYRLVTARPA